MLDLVSRRIKWYLIQRLATTLFPDRTFALTNFYATAKANSNYNNSLNNELCRDIKDDFTQTSPTLPLGPNFPQTEKIILKLSK